VTRKVVKMTAATATVIRKIYNFLLKNKDEYKILILKAIMCLRFLDRVTRESKNGGRRWMGKKSRS
jgi:hypothetical protein